jgi:hypothetical protein
MLVALLVFLAVFFCRDVQALAMDESRFGLRFALYAVMQVAGIGLFGLAPHAGWFAWAAILIQLAEVGAALALSRFARRFAWIGWVLPSPVFLASLAGCGRMIGEGTGLTPATMTALLTAGWLCVTGGVAGLASRMQCSSDDRKFAADFALLSSFAALVFVPFGVQ